MFATTNTVEKKGEPKGAPIAMGGESGGDSHMAAGHDAMTTDDSGTIFEQAGQDASGGFPAAITITVMGDDMDFSGKHLLLAYKTPFNLEDTEALKNIIIEAIKKSGAGIEGYVEKKFHPQGYSIAILISESHATIHTFPEENSLFVDFFTCGDIDTEPFREYLLKHVPADEIYEDTVILRPSGEKPRVNHA